MKAECRLCHAIIETQPDEVFDAGRDDRVRKDMIVRIATHIDPRMNLCAAPMAEQLDRWKIQQNNNGVFQRWKLYQQVTSADAAFVEKEATWRAQLLALLATGGPAIDTNPCPECPHAIGLHGARGCYAIGEASEVCRCTRTGAAAEPEQLIQ